MSPEAVVTIGQQALQVVVLLAAPLLLSALFVGLFIGMLQAATQINEMTLSFIPKLIVLVAALYLAGPWMLELITSYATRLIADIPIIIG
ncbi:MAG: flagellar biosynthesis protein FliQ [Pseudomonadota bacterium]